MTKALFACAACRFPTLHSVISAAMVGIVLIAHHAMLPSQCLQHHHIARLRNIRRLGHQQHSWDQALWFNQTLDHFDNQAASQTFQQRYFEVREYFTDPKGPIFLDVCGESECFIENDYYLALAKDMGAILVALEHRYYGQSVPTKDLSLENLRYLNTKQALFDLATFRTYYQESIIKTYNLSEGYENPWIVIGGSYAGALSAWFRVLFPHLVRGSISSSGIIHPIEDYKAYAIQVGLSMGPICASVYVNIARRIEEELEKNATYIKSLFNATQLNDVEFANLLGRYPSFVVQYGDPSRACGFIVNASHDGKDIMDAYIEMINSWTREDIVRYFKNDLLLSTNSSNEARAWFYQQCTELGIFQTAPPNNSIFLKQINLKSYRDMCAYVFGNNTKLQVDITNALYGGTSIAGRRILFLNGSQDPYRYLSKESSTQGEQSLIITCKNCGHEVDVYGCAPYLDLGNATSCSSPKAVYDARETIRKSIQDWISQE